MTSALGWWMGGSSATSGAIDIVSVRQNDKTFSCSPFHVKLPVRALNKGHKTVSLLVNGIPVKVSMRLGSAGEAFFIIKNHQMDSSQPPQPSATTKKVTDNADDNAKDIVFDNTMTNISSRFM